jgi:hypothetical protein
MKALQGLYLPLNTSDSLKQRADAVGMNYSDLADLCLRFGLARLSDDALRARVARLKEQKQTQGPLKTNDAKVLDALPRLLIPTRGVTPSWFGVEEIATEAGLPIREAYRSLTALRNRGLVRGVFKDKMDKWGRPIESLWRKP